MNSETDIIIRALPIARVNVNDILVGDKNKNKVPLYYNQSNRLIVQTPCIELANDIRNTQHNNLYEINTLFKGDKRSKIKSFHNFIEGMESVISNQIIDKGVGWFECADIDIKSLIRDATNIDGNVSQYIKWIIDINKCKCVDENGNYVDPLTLCAKDSVKLIVEFIGLWISSTTYGMLYDVHSILVKKSQLELNSVYMFNESDESGNTSDDSSDNDKISLLATERNPNTKPPMPYTGLHIISKMTETSAAPIIKNSINDMNNNVIDPNNLDDLITDDDF